MINRKELISLTGQLLNGMLSADDSVLSKIVDRAIHKQVAESAVGIAEEALRIINDKYGE